MEDIIPCVRIDFNSRKTKVIETIKKFHFNNKSIYLIPFDSNSINLAFFVADVFRRSGNFINCIVYPVNENFPEGMAIYICASKNTSLEKQITRENTLETLINEKIPDNVSVLTLRACGVACSIMFKYSTYLLKTGCWEYISNVNINAIPVKIDNKNIFKTTVQVKLQKIFYAENGI